jgi:A/G-specific adenine glycosylase
MGSLMSKGFASVDSSPWGDRVSLQDLRRRLLRWYRRNARELPWRENRDPYRVWISEIMLQQTQVATVRGYFERFIAALPTIDALAAAEENTVLRLWEGLGYYRRARQLHRAAQIVVAEHAGQFPRHPHDVLHLPGIGRYTAGAILSIAFDAREPILEANTIRLLSRLLAYRGDTDSTAGRALLWKAAETLLPARGSGTFNQALMELGSQICRPRDPDCPHCPLVALCPTFRERLQDQIPAPRRKPKVEEVRQAAIVVRRRGKILLLRRANGERWAGLWDFPRIECDEQMRSPTAEELIEKVRAAIGVEIEQLRHLTTLRHGVTRFRITLECYEARAVRSSATTKEPAVEIRWLRLDELEAYALNTTGREIASRVLAADLSSSR